MDARDLMMLKLEYFGYSRTSSVESREEFRQRFEEIEDRLYKTLDEIIDNIQAEGLVDDNELLDRLKVKIDEIKFDLGARGLLGDKYEKFEGLEKKLQQIIDQPAPAVKSAGKS